MTSNLDDLCVLPHVGPETQEILRTEGYESYALIAQASPFELHQNCSIGLSNTSAIINAAIEEMECPCPKCGDGDLSPIWGGYPGPLSDEAKENNDLFCSECRWIGIFSELKSTDSISA